MMTLEPREAARLVLRIAQGEDITITGGEPFDQAEALGMFVTWLKTLHLEEGIYPEPRIIIYSGYEWLDLADRASGNEPDGIGTLLALSNATILVDGPYRWWLDNDHMQWRGSSNQTVTDLPATFKNAKAIARGIGRDGYIDYLGSAQVLIDWDTPTIEVVGGELIATAGLFENLGLDDFGLVDRCGQFEGEE